MATPGGAASHEKPYREALRAIDQKKWDSAIDHLETAIERRPRAGGPKIRDYGAAFEEYLPYYFLGLALYESGRPAEALWQWEIAERERQIQSSRYERNFSELRRRAESLRLELAGVLEQPGSAEAIATTDRPSSAEEAGADRERSDGVEGTIAPELVLGTLAESHALVVGVSRYDAGTGWPSLPGVVDDIVAIERALRKQGFTVTVLRDPAKEELLEAMDAFFFTRARTEAARLVFYFAGHGATVTTAERRMGYIVPANAPNPKRDENLFRRYAVSMSSFRRFAEESVARHVMFLFDSCFSGSVFGAVRSGTVVPGSIERRVEERSRWFVAAGEADQEVPDESLFRRAFVRALDGEADRDGDGLIFGAELGAYIQTEVIDATHGAPNAQAPHFGRSGNHTLGDMPFRGRKP